MKRLLICLLLTGWLFAGCGETARAEPAPPESEAEGEHDDGARNELPSERMEQENSGQSRIPPPSPPPTSDERLNGILAQNNLAGSSEFLVYLLGNYETVAGLPDDVRDSFATTFQHILQVYERDGLHEAEIAVRRCRPVDMQSLLGVEEIHNRYGYPLSFYEIDVDVKSGREKRLPVGEQTWLAGFADDPRYRASPSGGRYFDFLQPYETAVQRLETEIRYADEIAILKRDTGAIGDATFSAPEELPAETLILLLAEQDVEKGLWGEEPHDVGVTMTQEQLNAAAKQIFGIDHVDGTSTALYRQDLERYVVFHTVAADLVGVMKAEKNGERLELYVDRNAFVTDYFLANRDAEDDRYRPIHNQGVRQILRYTYEEGLLRSVEAVDDVYFAPVILVGESYAVL